MRATIPTKAGDDGEKPQPLHLIALISAGIGRLGRDRPDCVEDTGHEFSC